MPDACANALAPTTALFGCTTKPVVCDTIREAAKEWKKQAGPDRPIRVSAYTTEEAVRYFGGLVYQGGYREEAAVALERGEEPPLQGPGKPNPTKAPSELELLRKELEQSSSDLVRIRAERNQLKEELKQAGTDLKRIRDERGRLRTLLQKAHQVALEAGAEPGQLAQVAEYLGLLKGKV